MSSTSKTQVDKSLAKHLLVKLGNRCPSSDQLFLLESLISKMSIRHDVVFHHALTPRESHCLLLAAYGKTMNQIADILSVKPSTIETWYKKIKRKLRSKTIAQAVFEGVRYGYVKPQGNE